VQNLPVSNKAPLHVHPSYLFKTCCLKRRNIFFLCISACVKDGVHVRPDIMIPLVGMTDELDQQAEIVRKAATSVQARTGEREIESNYASTIHSILLSNFALQRSAR